MSLHGISITKSVLVFLIYSTIILSQSSTQDHIGLTSYVNTFIGTSNGGNTFPGAVVPWGMLSVSPHNSLSAPSGYIYGEKDFYGFGMVHLSGTGCAELGSILITMTEKENAIKPEDYKNIYSSEIASPGFYSAHLDSTGINVEATATERSGFLKFHSLNKSNKTLVIDIGRSLGIVGGGKIEIVSNDEVEGYNISGGFCGEENREIIYFVAKFSKEFKDHKIWLDKSVIDSNEAQIKDNSVGALFNYSLNENEELFVKVGISYTSIENARLNLEAEIPCWNFDKVKKEAQESWENKLEKITVEDNNKDNLIKFYTAFYHTLIHPNIISDVNGEYPLMGRTGIGKYVGRKRYSVFSLWDTYRTLHPFLTLVFPEVQSEIIKTMIDMYKESGYLPKWELAGNETYMMVGDPATIVIADSYIKGIKDFDVQDAFEAMLKPALLIQDEKAPPIRAGYHESMRYGYIPFEQDRNEDWWVWGPVSTTLEYCLSDFSISQMANALGKTDISNEFHIRSLNYKNLFDSVTQFIRPKLKNGKWMEPFDELATEGSGDWGGSGGRGYVEGNAWNYTWFAPHDITGLIQLFGGSKKFSDKLHQSFINGQFTINNEPDIAYPYLFNYIKGEEHNTVELVHKILNENFGIDNNGLPGNDDCGTISAWFIFSALGFYPDCPSQNYYTLSYPIFDKVTIKLNHDYFSGKEIIISKKSQQDKNKIHFNALKIDNYHISIRELAKGGILLFY